MKIYIIRHGKTQGNLEGRYIGRIDEPLCEEGKEALTQKIYPEVEGVFSSPKLRCLETAKLLYPDHEPIRIPELVECNFGRFEGKTFLELDKDRAYQKWLKSGGTRRCPRGESKEKFIKRVVKGFHKVLEIANQEGLETIAMIVHGGTIMGILETYGLPEEEFYKFQVKNGEGYELSVERNAPYFYWRNLRLGVRGSAEDVPSGSKDGLDD